MKRRISSQGMIRFQRVLTRIQLTGQLAPDQGRQAEQMTPFQDMQSAAVENNPRF